MAIIPGSTVVGVFENRLQAEQAIAELHRAGLGAAAGGVLGALMDLGLGKEEARYYDNEFKQGRTIVAVLAGENAQRANEAREILHRHGAFDAYTPLSENTKHGASTGNDAADTTYPDHGVAADNSESFFAQPLGVDPHVPGTLDSPDLREP